MERLSNKTVVFKLVLNFSIWSHSCNSQMNHCIISNQDGGQLSNITNPVFMLLLQSERKCFLFK